MYQKMLETIDLFWDSFLALWPNLILAILFQLVFIFIGRALYSGFKKTAVKRSEDPFAVDFAGKAIKWLVYLMGMIIALNVLGFNNLANSLLTGAGISALIIGFALKDIFENLLAGVLLAVNRPFHTGNIIEISGVKGTVKGMDLRTTRIRNIEGKDIYIPNSIMIKEILTNYTKDGFLRMDFDIGMDVPSDLEKVKNLILEHLGKQAEILNKPEPNVLTTGVGAHTIDIKVLFWVNILTDKETPPAYLGATIKSRIIGEVKDLLLEHGFNMPNPILEHKMYEKDQPIRLSIEQ